MKNKLSKIFLSVGWLVFTALVVARPVRAYLDPGSGSYIIQIVVASLVSVGFFASTFWMKLQNLFGGLKKKEENDEDFEHKD